MLNESIIQKMKSYLTANQAKSVISQMKKRYNIYHAGQIIGRVLNKKFGYAKPAFVISGIAPDSVEKLGFECVDVPCLLTIMNYRPIVDQFIFGHVLSYKEDHMIADFMNIRHLSKAQMQVILTQIHQINRCFLPSANVSIRHQQIVITQKLFKDTFAKSAIHLLEDQKALQLGKARLDNGELYHF
ncbi:MAG: Hypothetical protein AJITA_00722 [Acetilactobacillus jinshanensis]